MGSNNYQEELKGILEDQKQILARYTEVIESFTKEDFVLQNQVLREESVKLEETVEQMSHQLAHFQKENQQLHEHIEADLLARRLDLIRDLSARLQAYIELTKENQLKNLHQMEQRIIQQLGKTSTELKAKLLDEEASFMVRIHEMQQELDEKIRAYELKIATEHEIALQIIEEEVALQKQVPVKPVLLLPTEQVVTKKKTNIELKIGLNWINKIGIILILIGAIIGMRYTYVHFFTPALKGLMGVMMGLVFLGGGLYCYSKEKKVFATGLTGGGIALLYITIFVSYFMLGLINMPIAITLSIGVSILSFVICHLYHSQTVGVFALIGGYLPIVTYGVLLGEINQVNAMLIAVYILLLNFVTLALSLKKSWPLVGYISFGFNIPATMWCAQMLMGNWFALAYLVINFLMYLAIVFAQPFVEKTKLRSGYIVITAFNTMISSVLICAILTTLITINRFGMVCLGFAIVYFGLERLTKRYLPDEESMRLVFYITSLTFAILIIPFQFDGLWIVMGWIIEGILFVIYGRLKNQVYLEGAGIGLLIISTLLYYFVESWEPVSVWWKYGSLLIALMIALVIYLRAMELGKLDERWDILVICYEYFVLFNLVNYIQYNLTQMYTVVMKRLESISDVQLDLKLLMIGIGLFVVTLIIQKVSLFRKSLPKYVGESLYGIVALIGLFASCSEVGVMVLEEFAPIEKIIYACWLLIYQLIVVWSVFSIYRELKNKASQFARGSIIVGVIYIVLELQCFVGMSWPYDYLLAQVILSIGFAVGAWRLIIWGFKQRFKPIRYCGLGLVFYAFGKLFLYDMNQLGSGYSIISFFGFGIVLLAISYVYQKFEKTMEE